MAYYIIETWSLQRVEVQDLSDEVARGVRNGHVLREGVAIHPDLLVGGLDVGSLEGRLADNQRVDNHSQRPDIDLVAVPHLPLQNLRRDVIRRTANGLFLFALEVQTSRKSEVAKLDFHLLTQKQVAQL